ncbi:MAG: 1,4-dihydroxy-2-naphthoate octaprenyltransferase, partial [Gemmatimonadetes bacterium]|nr:1,4-dihydroxy-2-naphthoate octaprenyltransferase [Gemmatimonadota bacterium]
FVFVFFGLVAVGGTYWVQAMVWPVDAVLAGAGIGALNTAILVVNNLRDIETDAKANKRTLAVRLGVRGTQVEYLVMLGVGAAVPVAGVVWLGWPFWALLSLVALALAVGPARMVLGFDEPRQLLPALGATARVVVVYGVLLGIGLGVG